MTLATLAERKRFDMLPLVVGFVSVLLVGLGLLQYRWTGELSEAERGRMRESLRARANQFARELDREVTRAFFWLQLVPSGPEGQPDLEAYAERYERWKVSAPDAGIVKAIYLAEGERLGTLRRYVPESRTFEPTEWPADLAAARDEALPQALDPGGPRGPRLGPLSLLEDGTPVAVAPAPIFGRMFATRPDGPGAGTGPRREPARGAVTGPLASIGFGPGPGRGPTFSAVRVTSFSIVVFDKDRLVAGLLPRLEQRHFPPDGDTPAFTLTLRRHDRPADVVYRSPGSGSEVVDASTGLLELRFEDLPEEDVRAGGFAFRVTDETGPPRREHRAGPRESRPPPRDRLGFAGRMLGGGRGRGEPSGLWSLQVAHRGGSVDALVAAARRRNLLVSFSVLLLLGTATLLLASAARRARLLAERQMEFVAAVSHELRTPVSVICSAGENLADGVVEGREGVVRYGALVRDEGLRLARLIEQVLDFAGTYTGRRPYRREKVAAEALVDEALLAAEPALKEAGFRVERDVHGELPGLVGDPAALSRALRNLVENAVKYGGDDRRVAVRARAAERGGRGYVRLEVEDHGLGIPAEEQKHLFEPFWRGGEATARQIRGSGLGLALVRSVARAHGGDVSVKSRPGEGSVFTVELPAGDDDHETSGARDRERNDDIAHPAG